MKIGIQKNKDILKEPKKKSFDLLSSVSFWPILTIASIKDLFFFPKFGDPQEGQQIQTGSIIINL